MKLLKLLLNYASLQYMHLHSLMPPWVGKYAPPEKEGGMVRCLGIAVKRSGSFCLNCKVNAEFMCFMTCQSEKREAEDKI